MLINKKGPLKGVLFVPGDKSISHRAVMLGSLANGTTYISNFLHGQDCLATINCFKQMGIEIEHKIQENTVSIEGKGLHGLKRPKSI